MRVEVWSPDGLEAVSASDLLYEVVEGENTPMLGLLDESKGGRVWLDAGDVQFLREMLAKTEFGL